LLDHDLLDKDQYARFLNTRSGSRQALATPQTDR
jgi:hypothetical protein